jgi:drug/metabolite transporter (DMT)-like permease
MSARGTARFEIAAAAVLFSTGGVAIKAASVGGWQVASLRSGIAAVALALLLRPALRLWSARSLLVGMAYAATMILFVLANKLTTSANAIFLQSAFPLYVLVLGPWLLHEPTRRQDVLCMAFIALGLAASFLGVRVPLATAPNPMLGNVLGTVSGVFWALTVVGLRGMARRSPGVEPAGAQPAGQARARPAGGDTAAAVVSGNAIAFLVCLPMAASHLPSAPRDWAILAFLGVFQIGLAYFFLTRGVRNVTALEASVLLLIEPALNPIWAWLVHHENPGVWSLVGGALIVGTTVAKTWWDTRRLAGMGATP